MVTLRGITWDHPRGYQPLAASADAYARQTGVHVTWDKRSLKDFGDAPIDALAEQYDLLIIDHPHVGVAAATRCLLPLDSCLDGETLATLAGQSAGPSHASYHYDGHQWALAVDAAMQAAVYRPDLQRGMLPRNWDEVLALGEAVRADGRYIAIPLVPTDCICSFLSLCASLGDPPGQEAGRLVGNAVGRRALDLLAAFRRLAHPDSLTWNPIRMLDHMSTHGDVVYCPLSFCYTNYARPGYATYPLRFANIPGTRGSLLGGTGYAVSARTPHPAEACAYGAWLCGAAIQTTLVVEHGGQPGNGAAWHDTHANALTGNFFADTLDTLYAAYVRPRHRGYPAFQEAAGNLIHALLRDGGSADDTLLQLHRLYSDSMG